MLSNFLRKCSVNCETPLILILILRIIEVVVKDTRYFAVSRPMIPMLSGDELVEPATGGWTLWIEYKRDSNNRAMLLAAAIQQQCKVCMKPWKPLTFKSESADSTASGKILAFGLPENQCSV
ncbi:hypothetical protein SADUNF_Sadunf04G0140300 [Salix dunnii]|uniref:Uncharacterized protein n=1 Tax=Salix dunnii TaxID=1413687 RepID=A0A835KEV5_9ROSI|nr:hypothetical protein SADUNF_Sadunf04G0140300 [Salix dunnii]